VIRLSIELSTVFTRRKENVANMRKWDYILQFRKDLLSPLTNKHGNIKFTCSCYSPSILIQSCKKSKL
jgi:hypothetical protein